MVTPRLFRLAFAAALILSAALPGSAQEDDGPTIEVIDLSGTFDDRLVEFATRSIEEAGAGGDVELVILQLDSPGAVASEQAMSRLAAVVADPPVPLVAWIGPAPAEVQGGVAQIFALAPLRMAAPGSTIGLWEPTIAGSDPGFLIAEPPTADLIDGVIGIDESIPGLVDVVETETASLRQVAQQLDGVEVNGTVLSTIRQFEAADGTDGVTVLTTVIRQPGLWDQFLRLASTPEAAFFFLVAGLTVAAFEFYAIGPGIASGVAAVSLLIAGYGLAVLPVRWWAVALAVAAVLLMSVSYQLGGVLAFTVFGLVGLAVAGFRFTDTAPQITPGIPGVLFTLASASFFFLLAMPTVARSRFSTQTIGREALIGRRGMATCDLLPDGEVEVEGARWKATSHREAGIKAGDPVMVDGVDGWFLDVSPVADGKSSS
jgi:membrane-bound serine protease (ClpP class)